MVQSIFSKKKIPLYLVSLVTIYLLYFLFLSDTRFFLFLVYSLRGLMGIVIMVIAINTYKISYNSIFTFLSVSLGLSGIIDSISVLITYHYHVGPFFNEYIYLSILANFLNIFSLIICSKLYNKDFNLRYVFIFYSSIASLLVVIFIFSLFVFEIFPPVTSVILLGFTIRNLLNLTLIILSIYNIYIYSKIKNDIEDNDLKNVFSLSIFYIVACTSFFLSSFINHLNVLWFLGDISLLFHLFFVSRAVLNSVLKKPYEMLFYDLAKKSKESKKIRDYYETVIESMPLSIIVVQNNKISFVNIATLKFLDYKSKLDLYDMDLYDILDDKSIYDYDYNIYKKSEFFEATFKKSTGELLDARVRHIDAIFHDTECTMLIIRDISATKKVQELSQTLEQKLKEEKMQTEFFSNISHELRTPINVIYGILQLEDIYIKDKNMDAIDRHNKTLKQNCLRLLRICNNLIDSSKIESGFFVPNMKYINIVTLIESIVSSVSTYTSIKNMTITFDTDSEDIYSICDHDLIERIILNLISNSMKYGFDGGNIWVNIYDEDDFAKIVFMDDGPGIPKEKCEDIFKRFAQVDKSFSRPSEGSGVGLSLVKSMVDMHDGSIEIESDEGMGCKFIITLPTVECAIDEIAATGDCFEEENSIVDKIDIEFSDIYF